MKLSLIPFFLFFLFLTEGVAQASEQDLSKTYQDRANWFRQIPQFDRDSIQFYFQKAVEVKPINYKRLAEIYSDQADYYLLQVRVYQKATMAAEKAWLNWEKIPGTERDINLQYDILQRRAMAVIENGETTRALKLYTQAYELLQANPQTDIKAKVLKDKAIFYIRYGLKEQRETALEALMESRYLYESLQDTIKYCIDLSNVYAHLSNFYLNEKNFDSCIYYLNKNIAVEQYVRNPYKTGWHQTIRAEAYIYIKNDYNEAEKYVKQARINLEKYKLTDCGYYRYCPYLLGEIAHNKGEYDKAIKYYKEAIAISERDNYRQDIIGGLLNLSTIYEKMGDYKQSLAYYKQYRETSYEVLKGRSERSMKENELQINVLNKEKEIEQQKAVRNYSMIGISLLGLLAFIIYRNYRSQKKLNAILNIRNEEKEFLIKEIHHRVKNNLQVLSSLLHLQSKHIKDDAALDAVREGQNRVEAMGLIHQKLYMGDNLAAVDMKDYLKNLGDTLLDSFGYDDDSVMIKYEVQRLHLDVDTAIPLGLVINELITNSLKYAFPKSNTQSPILNPNEITISLFINENKKLCLKVADNGVGKAGAPQLKNSTSFGTNLVQILSKKLRGKLEILAVEKGYATLIQFDEYKLVKV